MRGIWPLAAALIIAAPLWAKPGTPGPDYFIGSYEMVGRSSGAPMLQNGAAQIAAQGQGVIIRSCHAPDLSMAFGPAFEIVNLMTGGTNGEKVECLFHNNGYNRPILTCRSDAGAAFTLWPIAPTALAC